jgi:integrase/recombinase XerD
MRPSSLLAPHLQAFFADYLCQQKRLSPKTIVSCRDTFRLWLTFVQEQTGIEPSVLRIADLDAPAVLSFLNYLEQQRGNRCARAISAYRRSGRSSAWLPCVIRRASVW